jgi:hypothetical protein
MLGWLEVVFKGQPWLTPLLWVVGGVLLVVGLITACWKSLRALVDAWPTIKLFVQTVASIQGLPEFMERTKADLEAMKHQIENDHKSNMRDDITDAQKTAKRVERGVRGLHTKFAAMQKDIASLRANDAAAELRIDDIEKQLPPRDPRGRFTTTTKES